MKGRAAAKPNPWLENLGPGVVVTLISIPMSMGVAIASGVPPAIGLVTAIIGALVIGAITGSPLQISGPSAGLTVMIMELVTTHGVGALGVTALVIGLLQGAAGVLKLGQYFRAVSPAVINGMLAGIGVLLAAGQFHVMFDDRPRKTGLENITTVPEAIHMGVWPFDWSVHQQAAVIGLVTLAVLVGLSLTKSGPLSRVPAPLAAVGIATAMTVLLGLDIQRVDMPDSMFDAMTFLKASDLSMLADSSLLVAVIALGFVASAETLLCSSALDGMHTGPRTNYDRALLAQGVGNIICGILGVLPNAGVISRSSANVQAGAKGRQSSILFGVFLLLFVAVAPTLLEVVPKASLAAVLVFVGFRLVSSRPYDELRAHGKSELIIYVVTIGTIVGVNLLTGIMVGIVLALGKLAYSYGRGFYRFELEVKPDPEHDQTHVHLRGAASFIRLPKLASTLESLPTDSEVHLHVEELDYIDHACLDLLTKYERQRIQARNPVRIEWNALRHTYHARNPLDKTPTEHEEAPEVPQTLLDFLVPEVIVIDPVLDGPKDAIEKLGRTLARHHHLRVDGDALIDSALRRESESSTCVGGGLMVPHGVVRSRNDGLHGALAISPTGWDFGAPDGEPVKCIVLLATPKHAAAHHLAVLAAFARLFAKKPNLAERMLHAKSPEEVRAVLGGPDAAEINYAFERIPASQASSRPPPAEG